MNFKKNDDGFICVNCGNIVKPLGYSSRNHCPNCLHSLHVDIMPGDRANLCKGLLCPIDIQTNSKKGFIIVHKCNICGHIVKNKCAQDDNYNTILKIAKKQ